MQKTNSRGKLSISNTFSPNILKEAAMAQTATIDLTRNEKDDASDVSMECDDEKIQVDTYTVNSGDSFLVDRERSISMQKGNMEKIKNKHNSNGY